MFYLYESLLGQLYLYHIFFYLLIWLKFCEECNILLKKPKMSHIQYELHKTKNRKRGKKEKRKKTSFWFFEDMLIYWNSIPPITSNQGTKTPLPYFSHQQIHYHSSWSSHCNKFKSKPVVGVAKKPGSFQIPD